MKEIRLKTIEYLEKIVPNFKKTRGKNINFTCPQCLSDELTCHLISPTVPILMCTKCASQGKGRLGYVDEYYAKVRNCTPDEVLQDIVKVLSLTTPAPKTLKEFLDFYEGAGCQHIAVATDDIVYVAAVAPLMLTPFLLH